MNKRKNEKNKQKSEGMYISGMNRGKEKNND